MLRVNLSSLAFFDEKRIELLNSFVEVNKSLMPHAVAIATGCRLDEAMTFLLFLYGKYLVEGYLLIYHALHPDFYFERQALSKGLPLGGGYFCPVCETPILGRDEIFFDFEFTPIQDIKFVKQ